ncbi:hypothetical protein O6H91_19G063900 [Diphasiastrum complanatum]|uniref:Uncharacterized protein n=1 Tax=Diphasiastrum complanatum TaxID=34168 RepID=A0ACC2AW40_DIPCM|nr:hypothetical protein O6H91_19G063900 [Diphasiastrum complanatum]
MAVVVSAPGKVLITGAYLVLERPNAGLVLSTSARFFAIVKPLYELPATESWLWSWADIKVLSPQLQKETSYKLCLRDFSLQKVSSDTGNTFVEQSVQAAVSAGKIIIGDDHDKKDAFQKLLLRAIVNIFAGLEITILGSNDFYSYRRQIEAACLPLVAKSLASLPQFSLITSNQPDAGNLDKSSWVPEVAKTGLGSSAAMTTAVVGATLVYLGIVKLPHNSGDVMNLEEMKSTLDIVHALSQTAHCAAQGKVGSGFDISAAVYGSQRYVRFSPTVISAAQEHHRASALQASGSYTLSAEAIKILLDEDWDCERQDYSLPSSLFLILGEPGFGGSHTPSMVGAVQKWRKKEAESADIIWKKLSFANIGVEEGFRDLKDLSLKHKDDYEDVLEDCRSEAVDQWQGLIRESDIRGKIVLALLKTRQAFEEVRCLLREMGEAAGVPIEPPSQRALLDETMNIRGVLFAGVPGAGGFDAVFAVVIGASTRDIVEKEWCSRGVMTLCVKEDPRGVQIEDSDPRDVVSLPLNSLTLN